MGLLDSILGRTKAKPPDLERLFALPGAAVSLEVGAGLRPAGAAAVSLKPASGRSFADMQAELDDLVALAANEASSEVSHVTDSYGYLWFVVRDPDLDDLVTTVHLINSTLADRGFGPQLLASVFAFTGENDGPVHLVYLYKRGTFYPFVPSGQERRDNITELRVRDAVAGELPIESDLTRWFPIWELPLP
jgi:hypothetical protein